jgi:hypothetical protein
LERKKSRTGREQTRGEVEWSRIVPRSLTLGKASNCWEDTQPVLWEELSQDHEREPSQKQIL